MCDSIEIESIPYRPLYMNTDNERLLGAEEHEMPPVENFVTAPRKEARWSHLSDLDDFFHRIYEYQQRNGFWSMVLQDFGQLMFLWYLVSVLTFGVVGVNYEILFQVGANQTQKINFEDVILPWEKAKDNFSSWLIFLLVITCMYLVFRSQKSFFNIFKYWEMRSFYRDGLRISPNELPDRTWREVQSRVIELQSHVQMCLHKGDIDELDVYHRILRFKNYMVGLVHKSILPMKFKIPFLGENIFFTSGLRFNYEMILFWGPGAPFKNSWHLRSEYKQFCKREEAATLLSRRILIVVIINFLLSPLILIWTLLYIFFANFALFRADPGLLSARTWSLFARFYLRHYNELDHEFDGRLNRGYRASQKYMSLFWSPSLVHCSRFILNISSVFLFFVIILTFEDQDTLAVEGIFKIITILTIVITCCKNLIPDENMVKMPESLMRTILCQIHYIPNHWKGQAHTRRVQQEFSQLFQQTPVFLLKEVLSAVVAPFILLFYLRPRSMMIVDFFRNYTVSLDGLGDVCSLSHMELKKHTHYNYSLPTESQVSAMAESSVAEYKKMELSLLHFTLANPEWKAPAAETEFLVNVRQNVNEMRRELGGLNLTGGDNPLFTSSQALSMLGQPAYCSLTMSTLPRSQINMSGVSQKPDAGTPTGAESSAPHDHIQTWRSQSSQQAPGVLWSPESFSRQNAGNHRTTVFNEATAEIMSNEMGYSALYFYEHGIIRRSEITQSAQSGSVYADAPDEEADLARYFGSPTSPTGTRSARLPNIVEEEELVRQNDLRPSNAV